ncbi:MAG: hypothetical protein U5K43_15695 [Halofilum sp. (in: g-proteobacteria)]|nr:hypothetical protein [Halofilum sp. (in: g-proteobacteria)]
MSNAAYRSVLAVVLVLASPLVVAQDVAGETPGESPGDSRGQADAGEGDGTRAVGGTSVIGNREVPKSLYIVPWKNSEVGVRTDLSRDLLDEGLQPVDPPEFRRQVKYHEFHQQQQ